MAAGDSVPVPSESFEQTLVSAAPDVVREMFRAFAQQMMDAEVEVASGVGYGEVSPGRVNPRTGTGGGWGTPGPGRWSWRSRSCTPRGDPQADPRRWHLPPVATLSSGSSARS